MGIGPPSRIRLSVTLRVPTKNVIKYQKKYSQQVSYLHSFIDLLEIFRPLIALIVNSKPAVSKEFLTKRLFYICVISLSLLFFLVMLIKCKQFSSLYLLFCLSCQIRAASYYLYLRISPMSIYVYFA